MKIEEKIKKRINSIIQITGDIPKEINVTVAEYQELIANSECVMIEKLKNGKSTYKYLGVKLIIKN